MKKTLLLLSAIAVLAWAAWRMNGPSPVQADVPEKYRDTIHQGLEYLAKGQHKDGHWEGDGGAHPVAMTGLVGLALLMERSKPSGALVGRGLPTTYARALGRAVDWLVERSGAEREGLIFSGHESERSRYMQGHGLATLFLAGVLQDEPDETRTKKLDEVLRRAVKYIVQAQSSQGGWYDTSKTEGHDFDSIQASIIQIQALQAAINAGISVPGEALRDGQQYLRTALETAEKQRNPGDDARFATDAAAALAGAVTPRGHVTYSDGGTAADPWREKWEKFCKSAMPTGKALHVGRDALAHCYFAEEQVIVKSDAWASYRTALFDALQTHQDKDGSWPAGDGISVGPVYSTAVWCIVLQLDKNSHPSRQQDLFITTTRAPSALVDSRFALNLGREPTFRPAMRRTSS
jgi:hypothetical protein